MRFRVGLVVDALLLLFLVTGCQGTVGAPLAAPRPTPVLLPTETPAPLALPPVGSSPTQQAPASARTGVPTTGRATTGAPSGAVAALSPTPAAAAVLTPTRSPARIMAVGAAAAVALRSLPNPGAPVLVTLPGSDVLWAEGRSADSAWLRVAYGENGARAWAGTRELTVFGDASQLPVLGPRGEEAQSPAAGASGPTVAGKVSVDDLRVRGGPGVDQPVLGALAAGTAISIIGRSADGAWLAIRWPAGPGTAAGASQGWVAARYVSLEDGNVQDLPAVGPATGQAGAGTGARQDVPGGAGTGKIAFQTRSGGDIYVVNGDGSGLRRVAQGMDPQLASDGTRLAYARWDSVTGGAVLVLNLQTGEEQRVATAQRPRAPTWSPDSKRIAFARYLKSKSCYVTPLGCIDEATVQTIFGEQDCLDTPYGRFCLSNYKLVEQEFTGLVLVNLGQEGMQDLPSLSPVQSPTWRPVGEEIVYRSAPGLQALDGEKDLRPLLNDVNVSSPAWSADGQRLVVQVRVHDHSDIFVLNADGGGRAALTRREPLSEQAINNVAPTWSPDGAAILFLSDRDGAWRFYVMNADGSNQRPFLPGTLDQIPFSYEYAAERMASWSR